MKDKVERYNENHHKLYQLGVQHIGVHPSGVCFCIHAYITTFLHFEKLCHVFLASLSLNGVFFPTNDILTSFHGSTAESTPEVSKSCSCSLRVSWRSQGGPSRASRKASWPRLWILHFGSTWGLSVFLLNFRVFDKDFFDSFYVRKEIKQSPIQL